jgi:hypothetical protein
MQREEEIYRQKAKELLDNFEKEIDSGKTECSWSALVRRVENSKKTQDCMYQACTNLRESIKDAKRRVIDMKCQLIYMRERDREEIDEYTKTLDPEVYILRLDHSNSIYHWSKALIKDFEQQLTMILEKRGFSAKDSPFTFGSRDRGQFRLIESNKKTLELMNMYINLAHKMERHYETGITGVVGTKWSVSIYFDEESLAKEFVAKVATEVKHEKLKSFEVVAVKPTLWPEPLAIMCFTLVDAYKVVNAKLDLIFFELE